MRINNRVKKIMVLLLGSIMTIGVLLTGCGSSSSSGDASSSGVKVYYSTATIDDFKQLLLDSLTEAASSEGITLEVGVSDTVAEQSAAIKAAADSGYDVIICLAVDRTTALQLEASAGDVPIVFVNVQPEAEYLEKDKYVMVGSYEMNAGGYQAEYVWNALGCPSSINAVMLRGELSHNAAVSRTVSVTKYFEENGVDCNYVYYDTANWDTEEAAEAMRVFLKTGQSFDAVFCNNDSMAVGAVAALKEAGYDLSKIPVVGVDATAAGCQAIVDGEMQFTVYQSATDQGKMALAAAKALATTGTCDGIEGLSEDGLCIWVPFEKVDATNVSDYM